MRIWLITLLTLITLAAGAGSISYFGVSRASAENPASDDSLAWLKAEFKLDAEQTRRIGAMHDAYEIVCAEHCAAIRAARAGLERLRAAGANDESLRQAASTLERVETTCRSSTEAHVRSVAAIMSDRQGARYLALVLPKLAQVEHTGAPDLRANSAGARHGH
jgi:hypothetical protein